jgi:hypothetical protein
MIILHAYYVFYSACEWSLDYIEYDLWCEL